MDTAASQQVLDNLLTEEQGSFGDLGCPDCSAAIGKEHLFGCDVARCLECGTQRLSCDCESDLGGGDIWDGLWPGTRSAYEKGYIRKHRGKLSFDFGAIDAETMILERLKAKRGVYG